MRKLFLAAAFAAFHASASAQTSQLQEPQPPMPGDPDYSAKYRQWDVEHQAWTHQRQLEQDAARQKHLAELREQQRTAADARTAADRARNQASIAESKQRRDALEQDLRTQIADVRAEYLPKCKDQTLLRDVATTIEDTGARDHTPIRVLGIHDIEVFAATRKGYEVAYLVHNVMSVRDAVGAHWGGTDVDLPICVASVITNHEERTWGYGWKTVDGRTYVSVRTWDN